MVKAPGAGLTHFTVLGAQALGSTWCREATCSQQEDKFNPQSLGFPTRKWQNATNSSVCRGLMHTVGEGPSWRPVNVTPPRTQLPPGGQCVTRTGTPPKPLLVHCPVIQVERLC